MVACAAVLAVGFGAAAGSLQVVAAGVIVLATAHLRLLRWVHGEAVAARRDVHRGLPTATIAQWMQSLGRRTGQLKADGWVCRACLQANVAWDDECGRCGAENLDGVLTRA